MSNASMRRIVRQSGVLNELLPGETIRQQQAIAQTFDATGSLTRDAIKRFMPATRYRFHVPGALAVGDAGGMDQITRAGTVTRFRAHVGTAPSTATCIVELRDSAANVLATVTIPTGQTEGTSDGLTVPVNGSTWIGLHIAQTGSAADLSAVVTQEAT